jgi:hypothetical protein
MPLIAPAIRAKFVATIHAGLKREFYEEISRATNYPPIADPFWLKLSNAIADIAMDIVDEIHQNAQVVPGQQVTTSGGPSNQSGQTVSPGKIV